MPEGTAEFALLPGFGELTVRKRDLSVSACIAVVGVPRLRWAFHNGLRLRRGVKFGKSREICEKRSSCSIRVARSFAIRRTHPAGNQAANRSESPTGRGPVGDSLHLSLQTRLSSQRAFKMAKRCAYLLASLVVMTSAVGCCCSHLGRNNCSPCATGGCQPSYYPPNTGYYQGYGSTAYNGTFGQTAYVGDPALMASPAVPGSTFTTTTALAPVNSLPTY